MRRPENTRYRITNLIRDHRLGIRFMKRQTAKQNEAAMRFFTPERYVQFNSADDAMADRADAEWEIALRDYRRHLDQIGDRLTSRAADLAELALHDAEVHTWEKEINPTSNGQWSAVALMTLQCGRCITTFIYTLWDQVRDATSPKDWPFSKKRTHWLYDEIDIQPRRTRSFWHRILLSDGRVLAIPFIDVVVHDFAVSAAKSTASRKTA